MAAAHFVDAARFAVEECWTMSNALDQAKQLLEHRLAELDEERRRVTQALGALGEKNETRSSTTRAASTRRRGDKDRGRRRSSSRRTPSRRQSSANRAQELLDHVKEQPKASNAERAEALGVSSSRVSQLLTQLRKDGKLKAARRKSPGSV
jgi:predicted HTH transcriptional regulator